MKYLISARSDREGFDVSYVTLELSQKAAADIAEDAKRCQDFLAWSPEGKYFGEVRLGLPWFEAWSYNDDADAMLNEAEWVAVDDGYDMPDDAVRIEICCVIYSVDGGIRLTASDKNTSAQLETVDIADLIQAAKNTPPCASKQP